MTEIERLASAWRAAKKAEATANEKRIAIEVELAKLIDMPDEGSKTVKGEGYKITVTQPVTRKLDADAWESVRNNIPESLWPVKVKTEADATGCKYLANNEPEMWRKVASAFEAKPGKPSFKVEEF